LAASLFALSNGYVGVRGDGDGDGARGPGHGTFVNGLHETFPIHHPEPAHGLAWCGQASQGVPDAAGFDLWLDQAPLAEAATLVWSQSELDFRRGATEQTALWRLPGGDQVLVRQRRLVSLVEAHLAVFDCAVTVLDGQHQVRLAARLEGDPTAVPPKTDPAVARAKTIVSKTSPATDSAAQGLSTVDPSRAEPTADHRKTAPVTSPATPEASPVDPRRAEPTGGGLEPCGHWRWLEAEAWAYRCRHSRQAVALGLTRSAVLEDDPVTAPPDRRPTDLPLAGDGSARASLTTGQSLHLTTTAAYHSFADPPLGATSLAVASPGQEPAELVRRCRHSLAQAGPPERLWREQAVWLERFWERADVRVETGGPDDALQQAIRWCLFQLAQASAQTEGLGVAAKGLTGSGYSGHRFWDTEIYLLPFLVYTDPGTARQLLRFRHAMLPSARRQARRLDLDGALFPWRTINGEEASAYYPAGTAQFHIDADIAFAACQYAAVSGDQAFLAGDGLDLLVETARMWLSLGFWQTRGDGLFHIHGVTGPDEYSALVNDNFYTNVMARFNLLQAAAAWERLTPGDPAAACGRLEPVDPSAACERLTPVAQAAARLGLTAAEAAAWRRAGEQMFIPWEAERGLHPQDADFLTHPRLDLAAVPPERRPLLLHYHPLVIYRHQVLKQADVVLALFLRGADFSPAQKRADFDYYNPLTTGDSTLSAVSQAVLAAEVGHQDLALELFAQALFLDLADRHHNSADGVHLASAAGVWSVLVNGFGGLRDHGLAPSLSPRLPAGWRGLEFRLALSGARVAVRVESESITLELVSGPTAELVVDGRPVRLDQGGPIRLARPAPEPPQP
jgi:alpha,alpha-trehalose phosphorylase